MCGPLNALSVLGAVLVSAGAGRCEAISHSPREDEPARSLARLLTQTHWTIHHDVIHVLARTGARPAELAALRWDARAIMRPGGRGLQAEGGPRAGVQLRCAIDALEDTCGVVEGDASASAQLAPGGQGESRLLPGDRQGQAARTCLGVRLLGRAIDPLK